MPRGDDALAQNDDELLDLGEMLSFVIIDAVVIAPWLGKGTQASVRRLVCTGDGDVTHPRIAHGSGKENGSQLPFGEPRS